MHARRSSLWRRLLILAAFVTASDAGYSPAEVQYDGRVVRGQELFTRVWAVGDAQSPKGDGLGPMYNADSCVACHEQGGVGGGGPKSVNVQLLTFTGVTNQALAVRQALIPARLKKFHEGFLTGNAVRSTIVLHRQCTERGYDLWRDDLLSTAVQPETGQRNPFLALVSFAVASPLARLQTGRTHVQTLVADELQFELSERNTPALFGAGLINSVTEKLLAHEARQQARQFPGITGRVPRSLDGRLGRFGWRGQVSTLQDFVQNACAVELGLQLRNRRQAESPFPALAASAAETRKRRALSHTDMDSQQVTDLVAFVANLPKPKEIESMQSDTLTLPNPIGESVFISVGCAACHPRRLGSIDGLYSDLLLHNMGPALSDSSPAIPVQSPPVRSSGYGGGSFVSSLTTSPSLSELRQEWRTPPLWGVRDSAPYLHDGRAETLEAAILAHAGEAASAIQKFRELPAFQQASVIEFLETLVAP
jgi:CxxC motif-containing protein (DUF1111 family)